STTIIAQTRETSRIALAKGAEATGPRIGAIASELSLMMKVLVYPLVLVALVLLAFGCEASDPGTNPGGSQCPGDQVHCGDGCVALQSNAAHCGACNNACPGGTSCSAGQCSCLSGLTSCNATCVDLGSDPANCGGCAIGCAATQACSRSAGADGCDPSLTQCGQSCVDVNTSVLHCGGCNNRCPGGRLCQNGACACERAAEVDCGGVCVDTQSDPTNCGGCGVACGAGVACVAGVCSGATGGLGGGPSTTTSPTGSTSRACINERGRVAASH